MRSFIGCLALACGSLASLGCSQQEVVAQLRSLAASEDAVFLCRDGNGVGHPFADCPDRDATDDAHPAHHLSLMALVSQTVTDEVAVVNVSSGGVVDVDPGTPGFGFLRVAGRPVGLAVTPGGMATFVATADVGRNGIFALPTTCLGAPNENERQRDLTTWPACRLPETPGEIAVVVDAAEVPTKNEADESQAECALGAHLADEAGPTGTRKLIVSFPDTGELGVIDAQSVLKAEPGAFPECEVKRFPLKVEVPASVTQTLPTDLQTSCAEVPPPGPPVPSAQAPRPAGFAFAENRLYVADRAAPVIHVIDTTKPTELVELPSLLPMSLREPERVVTTRRVAVSPLTPAGQRFVYAIDTEDQPGASVMVFDVSPGSTNPTPIVRSGAPELPGEKPDRLFLDAAARDVTFAYRDIPYVDPATGAATFGDRCNPEPTLSINTPGALARPSTDLTLGARPGLLRGLFAFILQTDGKIAVVDVDDFDAACRRPTRSGAPFQGCSADATDTDYSGTDQAGRLYVTGEASCRVVQPHRFRSARPLVNSTASTAGRAPALRGFPTLTWPATASSVASTDRPRLLAVPYDVNGKAIAAEVSVSGTTYSTEAEGAEALTTDPNERRSELLQTMNTVVLPPLEPRAYATDDTVSVTYEGSFAGKRTAGFLSQSDEASVLAFRDASVTFCGLGVYDAPAMASYAQTELGLKADEAQAFGDLHADHLQITADFPEADDSYWSHARLTREQCETKFGALSEDGLTDSLDAQRDLKIIAAAADKLLLKPAGRGVKPADVTTCFPGAVSYEIRSAKHWVVLHSNTFRHDVVEGADRACVRSCSPLAKWAHGRVFEISSEADHCRALDPTAEPLELRVGCATKDDVACVYNQEARVGVGLQEPAARCIFNGLNERFALYRGRADSQRGATFRWQTTGGFTPLVMNLRLQAQSSLVSPQSIQYLGQVEQLAVVDGATQGLALFSLDTFGLVKPSPFY